MNQIKVTIRPIEIEDTLNIVKWRNKDSVRKNLFTQDIISDNSHLEWYNKKILTGECFQFIIELNENEIIKPIGTIFIKNIDHKNRKGEYGIFIGEENERGKGYGRIASELILDYGFNTLKLNRIYLSVFSENVGAIKLYESIGFKKEGELIQDFHDGLKYKDILIMGILNEYKK